MLRTIKEEVIWIHEFSTLEDPKQRIGQWIEIDCNKLCVHSELGYISPEEFEELYVRQISFKEAA